ncbi:hypothetical protein HMPREF3149_00035 [Corynebacterium sp. HMSC05E07]|nr:hypothetical protein HMPREF3149_00035 [Corynebacterium sp. HMSC05E07]
MTALIDVTVIGSDDNEPIFTMFGGACIYGIHKPFDMLINRSNSITVFISHEAINMSGIINTAAVRETNIEVLRGGI